MDEIWDYAWMPVSVSLSCYPVEILPYLDLIRGSSRGTACKTEERDSQGLGGAALENNFFHRRSQASAWVKGRGTMQFSSWIRRIAPLGKLLRHLRHTYRRCFVCRWSLKPSEISRERIEG